MESRGCTVVAVLRERAEGGIGGRFWGKVCKLFAVDVGFDDPCLFSLSSLAILGDGEVLVCLVSGSRRQ